MYYVSLGFDCSPASALRNLNLRDFALPFDWVESNYAHYEIILNCITDDFRKFHKNIKLTRDSKRIIDAYGIQYPHDYPNTENIYSKDEEDHLYDEKQIVPNYADYTPKVLEKYARRIERFREIFTGNIPIIVLYRGVYMNAQILKTRLESIYNRSDIVFVVATHEQIYNDEKIICCNPEKNGGWNEAAIWLEAIELAKTRFVLFTQKPIPKKMKLCFR